MKIHCLQHVPFEGLGYLETILKNKGYEITVTKFYLDEPLPKIDYQGLIIMGGPMNIYEDSLYSWLPKERAYIKQAIDQGIKVLGICLGSQFIADALGARVYQGAQKEIGWFPIRINRLKKPFERLFKDGQMVFHWHGDTFDLPKDSVSIADSKGCKCQGFIYKNHVVGLQFHLEMGEYEIERIIEACGQEILEAITEKSNLYVQSKENILKKNTYFNENYRCLENLVNALGW